MDTEKIVTDAGTYTLTFHTDTDADAPDNEGFGFVYDGGHSRIDVRNGDNAGAISALLQSTHPVNWRATGVGIYTVSSAALVRYLRLAYGIADAVPVTGEYQTYDASTDKEKIAGVAWADVPADRRRAYVDACVAEYRAWADGDVFGYVLTGPDGDEIDACWGYYGFDANVDYVRDQARAAALWDASDRARRASLVGAGFVGII